MWSDGASKATRINTATTTVLTTGGNDSQNKGRVYGIVVASTTGGTIQIFDNNAASGTTLLGTITPAAGAVIDLFGMPYRTGLTIVTANTIDCTVMWS